MNQVKPSMRYVVFGLLVVLVIGFWMIQKGYFFESSYLCAISYCLIRYLIRKRSV